MPITFRDRNPGDPDTTAPAVAIVASARRIDLADKKATVKALGRRQDWQDDAWLCFDAIGEIKYVDTFLGNGCGRLRLFAATQPDPTQPPIPVEESGLSTATKAAAIDALKRIKSDEGGQAAIIRAITVNLEVAGECWLLAYDAVEEQRGEQNEVIREAAEEHWDVRSISEVQGTGDGTVNVKSRPDASWEPLPTEGVRMWRIWERHPRWSDLPDSPLHGVLSECDELLILSRSIRAQGRSRIPAGVFTVPTELSFGPLDPTSEEQEDPFAVMLMEAMMAPVQDEGDPSALVPLVIRGKGEHLTPDKLRHITFDRPIDAVAAEQRKELMERIAQGLNAPPELITGVAGVNHWTAWQIDESTFSSHIEPRAIGIVDALTSGPYRPLVKAYPGVNAAEADQVFIWYDASGVVTKPNRGQDANDAWDRHAISDEAYRTAKGFSEGDAPDADELARRLAIARGAVDAPMAQAMLAMYMGLGNPFLESVQEQRALAPAPDGIPGAPGAAETPPTPSPTPLPPGPPADGAALVASGRSNPGRRLARIDTDLFTRLRVAADAALTRSLEKAGARLRSKASRVAAARTAVEGVDNRLVAATLGPAMVASLEFTEEELLEGAFDSLRVQWDAWVANAQRQALDIAFGAFGVPEDRRPAIERQQTVARDEAWVWLSSALHTLAREKLYDPKVVVAAALIGDDGPRRTTATLIGEIDPTLNVPASMIREAMARGGGAQGLAIQNTSSGGVRITAQAGTIPAGGVATGQEILGLAADEGFPVDWYEWQHGSPSHPFEPHAYLDGVTFYGETDPNIANDGDWPPDPYFFPGDHGGCTCSAVPVFGAGPDRTGADLIG